MAAVVIALLMIVGADVAGAANMNEGKRLYAAGEFERAFEEVEPLAKDGEAQAQHFLGVMYANGQYVAQDSAIAAQWFREAADQGHAISQLNLAILFARGDGVERSFQEAYFWSSLARLQLTGKQGDAAGRLSTKLGNAIGPVGRSEVEQRISGWQATLRPPKEEYDDPKNLAGIGTGFFISDAGVLLTNAHVVSGCDKIVVLHNGNSSLGKVLDMDFVADLAIVSTDMEPFGIVEILKGPRPAKDTAVMFFGYAPRKSGRRRPLRSDGVILEPHQHKGISAWMTTSAPAYSGQSGSALLDEYGRMVGVVLAISVGKERIIKRDVQGGPAIAAGNDTVVALLRRAHVQFTFADDFGQPVSLPQTPPFIAQLECWSYLPPASN